MARKNVNGALLSVSPDSTLTGGAASAQLQGGPPNVMEVASPDNTSRSNSQGALATTNTVATGDGGGVGMQDPNIQVMPGDPRYSKHPGGGTPSGEPAPEKREKPELTPPVPPTGGPTTPPDTTPGLKDEDPTELNQINPVISAGYSELPTGDLSAAPGSSYITPESLVQNQLEKILDPNSALMKRAQSIGAALANSLGLQSSTAGLGIMGGQMIDRALQIATPDAQTHAAAQLAQQKADYAKNQTLVEGRVSSSLQQQRANLDAQQAKLQAQFQYVLQNASQESQAELSKWLAQYENDSTLAQIEAKGNIDKALQDGIITAQQAENGMNSMMQAVLNTQISIENALRDPEILALGPEAMTDYLNILKDVGVASMQMVAQMYNMPASAVDYYANLVTWDLPDVVPPEAIDEQLNTWNNYVDTAPPPGVSQEQWDNEAWRVNWVRTNPDQFDAEGRPIWW